MSFQKDLFINADPDSFFVLNHSQVVKDAILDSLPEDNFISVLKNFSNKSSMGKWYFFFF